MLYRITATGPLVFRTSISVARRIICPRLFRTWSWRMSCGVAAELLVGLDVDLPGPAELVEVVDIIRAQVDLQGVEQLADRHAQGHALGPVDLQVQPGGVGPRAVEQALEAGRPVAPLDDRVADLLQVLQPEVAAVLDDQLEAAGRAQAVDRRGAEDRDGRRAHLALQRSRISSAMASAERWWPRRCSNGSSRT